ncbi:hypothetical protein BDZ91DRAFT_777369, partial [Kalaharituber pfeilii]
MADEDSTVNTVSSLRSRFEQMMSPTTPSAEWDSHKGKLATVTPARLSMQLHPQHSQPQHHSGGAGDTGGGFVRDQEPQDPFAEHSQRRNEVRSSVNLPARNAAYDRTNHGSVRDTVGVRASKLDEEIQSSSLQQLAPPTPPIARPTPRPRPQSMGILHQPRITPSLRIDSPKSPALPLSAQHTGIGKSKTPPPVPPPRDSQRISRPTSPTRETFSKNPPPIPASTRPRPAALSIKPNEN